MHQLPSYQRPSTAPNSGMMKRLMAKPAPLSSPSHLTHTFPTIEDEQQQRSPSNEFYKSIRALDLVGKLDISMSPCVTTTTTQEQEQGPSSKKQRNVLRRRPSKNTTTISRASTPMPPESNPLKDEATTPTSPQLRVLPKSPNNDHSSTPLSTTTTTIPRPRPRPLPPTPTQIEEPATLPYYTVFGDTSGKVVAAGGPRDAFWDTFEGDWVSKEKLDAEEAPATTTGLTRVLSRTVSGKWKKSDSGSDQQLQPVRSKPSFQELRRSLDSGVVVADNNRHKLKRSPESPGGGGEGTPGNSPSRRFWKLVKKISVGGLREKYQTDEPPPPVPPLPITHDPYRPLRSSLSSDSSLVQQPGAFRRLKKVASASTPSVSSPTVKANKTTSPPPSTQHHPKILPHPSPSQPTTTTTTTGPRPSTTTRSSSHSSDVASSRFFNRTQSARSSTSSFGEEVTIPPPLPKSPTKTYSKTNETKTNNDNNNSASSRKLQQHIIPPSELIRTLSTSNFPITTTSTTTTKNSTAAYSPPSPQDDWTIVRSPSVELETFSLPPPPRRLGKGVGIGVGSDRKGVDVTRIGGQNVIPASKMLKMVNMSTEKVDDRDEKSRDVLRPSPTRSLTGKEEEEEEEEEEPTTAKPEQEDNNKVWDWKQEQQQQQQQSHSDPESDRSPSPTIPSFSTTSESAINSFPARRVSSSASRNKGSPTPISPVSSSDRNSGGGYGIVVSSSTTTTAPNGPSSISPSPQRSGSPPQRSESRSAFGRVRHHLFRTKAEEEEEDGEGDAAAAAADGDGGDDDGFLNPLPSSRKSEIQIARLGQLYTPYQYSPQQQQHHHQQPQARSRKHHRHSSGSTSTTTISTTTSSSITKSRSAHAIPTSSTSTARSSPIITFHHHPHRRSMSFNTTTNATTPSSTTPLNAGLFSSARSSSPFLSSIIPQQQQSSSRLREEEEERFPSTPPPPPPPAAVVSSYQMTALSPPPPPPPAPSQPQPLPTLIGYRTRSPSTIRSGFSTKKISEVLFSSSSSPSATASPSPSTPPTAAAPPPLTRKRRPSSISGHRTIGGFINRSISVGAARNSNHNSNSNFDTTTNTAADHHLLPRPALTDQQKADKWNDLLDRSARAGGTLHLVAAGSRVLGSDRDREHDHDDL